MDDNKLLKYEVNDGQIKFLVIAGMPVYGGKKLFLAKTCRGVFENGGVGKFTQNEGSLYVKCHPHDDIEVDIAWNYTNGIVERVDSIKNISSSVLTLHGYYAMTDLSGIFDYYTQANHWGSENQGAWECLSHGAREIASRGRPCRGVTPYMAIRSNEGGPGMAVHLLADGDWFLRIESGHEFLGYPYATLSSGPAHDVLAYPLQPGESLDVSHTVFVPLADGKPETGAAVWQKHLLSLMPQNPKTIPIEYNTWFYCFENIDESKLLQQLEAAAEMGCEVFTIDAGWYGRLDGDWSVQVGDWREKTDGAFFGDMKGFADKVRAKGLQFGIWIEPERYSKKSPIVLKHPDWFYPDDGDYLCIDLDNEDAAAYLFDMISDVIERYGALWVKIDFNHALGLDPNRKAHMGYTSRFRRIINDLRELYPELVFENCASGGSRTDVGMVKYFAHTWVTDNQV